MTKETNCIIMISVVLILFASVVTLPTSAQQAPPTIFVSTSGSDTTGTGSITSPYATISHAVSSAPTGAIVIVEPGMYDGMVNISRTVTLESLTSNPSNTIINATGKVYGIFVLGADSNGTVIEGLTVELANNHGIFVQDSFGVTIEHNDIVSNGLRPVACPSPPATPTGPCIQENKAIELTGTSHSTVVDNQVINNMADGGIGIADDGQINPGGLSGGSPNAAIGNVVSGNTVIGNLVGCGIVVAAYNPGEGVISNIVTNNYVINGLPGGIVVAADVPHTSAVNNTVAYNTVLNNKIPGIIVHSNTPGDIVAGTIIKDNTISGNGGFGPKTTGITLIGQINSTATVVSDTFISGNVVRNEFFGILALNSTGTTVSSDNSFDPTVTVPVSGASIAAPPSFTTTINSVTTVQQAGTTVTSVTTVSSVTTVQQVANTTTASALGIVGIVIALVAVGIGAGALRRKPKP
ncbi:MAG: right-handed parallel beta-helix repeat-containing protein [Nitrososphaerota archaeon]|nr:right-handed parallel beta-helix repeat-containing protein [Nitrososphaerota archaeon]